MSKHILKITGNSRQQGKNPPFGVLLELSVTKTMQKESIHLDLWFRNGGWSKFSQISELNLNK